MSCKPIRLTASDAAVQSVSADRQTPAAKAASGIAKAAFAARDSAGLQRPADHLERARKPAVDGEIRQA